MPDSYGRRPRYLTDKLYDMRLFHADRDPDLGALVHVWADSLSEAVAVILEQGKPADWVWAGTSDTAAALGVECVR